jgi:hypothetical protein
MKQEDCTITFALLSMLSGSVIPVSLVLLSRAGDNILFTTFFMAILLLFLLSASYMAARKVKDAITPALSTLSAFTGTTGSMFVLWFLIVVIKVGYNHNLWILILFSLPFFVSCVVAWYFIKKHRTVIT